MLLLYLQMTRRGQRKVNLWVMKSRKLKTYFIRLPCGNDGDENKNYGDEDNFVMQPTKMSSFDSSFI